MSAICARPSKGKGVIHKRVENRRLSTLLCARAASARSSGLQLMQQFSFLLHYAIIKNKGMRNHADRNSTVRAA